MSKFAIRLLTLATYATTLVVVPMVTPAEASSSRYIKKHKKIILSSPGFSYPRAILAAALVKLGRIDEAKIEAARVLALQPSFSIGEFCAVNDPAPEIALPMTEALRAAGLPE